MNTAEQLFIKEFNAFMPSNEYNGIHDMYAVAQYTRGSKTNYFRADTKFEFFNQIHPEITVMEHLLELLKSQDLDSPNIKIYTSDAPCHECCQKFLQLLQTANLYHNQDLQIEIVFSGIHRIKRPSCVKENSCSLHLSQISDNQHQVNVDGLKALYNTRGVRLRPFTDQDWLDLLRALWRPKTKDEILKKDFEQIMNFNSTIDQIEQSSQCTTAMSLSPTQKSESDEPGYVSLDKQNEPDMRTTPEVCAGSDEEEEDGITARKRKREDESGEDERRDKKLMKENERKEKGEYQEEQVKADEVIIHEVVTPEEVEATS
ncbi:uncharacterized protein LOC112568270 isoform X1 [Pomacea canaliculata]|uniref:uncharacterized protein LOC112568270 isoform X1 n=1 Tax=Pomacea canaliculata TaxID=400727 RepID=UPI000D73F150|nr:uncharacterized protein LOC112568270 isoform X1 [Pomacea canaliculata]